MPTARKIYVGFNPDPGNMSSVTEEEPFTSIWGSEIPCDRSKFEGVFEGAEYAVEGGQCLLATTAPLHRIYRHDDLSNAPNGMWSADAGNYYCNEVYYRTLHEVRSQRILPAVVAATLPESARSNPYAVTLLPVVFVHVPPNRTRDDLKEGETAYTSEFATSLDQNISCFCINATKLHGAEHGTPAGRRRSQHH